jgi:hypothetical protein
MSVPSLIVISFPFPSIGRELGRFGDFGRRVDSGKSIDQAEAEAIAKLGL